MTVQERMTVQTCKDKKKESSRILFFVYYHSIHGFHLPMSISHFPSFFTMVCFSVSVDPLS